MKDKDKALELIAQRVPDSVVSQMTGFNAGTIANWRMQLGLPKPQPKPDIKLDRQKEPPPPKVQLSPVTRAVHVLGGRVTQKRGGYWLDGRPVSIWVLIDEADRLGREWGMEPIRTWRKP